MSFTPIRLPEIQQTRKINDKEGRPTPEFTGWLNGIVRNVRSVLGELVSFAQAILDAQAAADAAQPPADAAAAAAADAVADAATRQPGSPILDNLSDLTGDGVVLRNVDGTFTPRPIGTAAPTDILDRAAADTRYALAASAGVSSFNTRTGALTLTSGDVTAALTYTPTSVTGLTGVQSVAAFKTGLSLVKGDVGLGSVDNTADAAKNVLSATKLTTARNIDGQAFDGTGNVTIIAPGTHAATSKASPVDADELPLVDSAAANVLKKLTWANLKATLKTYLDTLYQPLASALTSWASVTRASGFDTFTATPSSANLRALITDETGTGSAVFSASPTFTGSAIFAGLRQAGSVVARFENTFGSRPTGSTGPGLEIGVNGGAGFFQNFDASLSTYVPFRCDALSYTFNVNGTTAWLTVTSAGAAAMTGTLSVSGGIGSTIATTQAAGDNSTKVATTAYARQAAPNATYRTILDNSGFHTDGKVAGTYAFGQGDALAASGTGIAYPLDIIYIDSADFPSVDGLATKLRIRCNVHCNDVAPGCNFVVGLYPVTRPATSGGAGVCIYTLGTVVTGSTLTVTTPAADSSTNGVSSDFALPANGFYAIGVVTNATVAASAHVHLSAALQLRNA